MMTIVHRSPMRSSEQVIGQEERGGFMLLSYLRNATDSTNLQKASDKEHSMNLTGRTILITGGSAGIGLAFAEKFLALGNTVIITGRSIAKLEAAKSAHPALHTIQCDAADPGALQALAARIAAEHPTLDVLLNNAGIFEYRNLSAGTDDLVWLTREIEVNLMGAIRTISVLVDRLKTNQGTIINVSSGLAFVPLQAAPIYCATKAGLHSYTITLRQQLAGKVEVIELMPPAVKTALTE
ncbi:MAG: putative oxidoreductase, partial [Myxococcota bacterium]